MKEIYEIKKNLLKDFVAFYRENRGDDIGMTVDEFINAFLNHKKTEFFNEEVYKMKEVYDENRCSNVGDTICCPSCGSNFEKKTYNHIFCNTKIKTECKDKYWNTLKSYNIV